MSNPDASDRRTSSDALTERDRAVLAFERDWQRHPGAKEEAIRTQLGLSGARYYQVLNALIDTPAAVVLEPMLVRRLQRIRDARAGARATRSERTRGVDVPRTD